MRLLLDGRCWAVEIVREGFLLCALVTGGPEDKRAILGIGL
jgi:hypothetical protein